MATGSDIAKAGWLYRQSSVLHRWKKNWFVLYRDGDLRYFETPDSHKAEERIVLRAWVRSIRVGPDCRRVDPPEGFSNAKNCYLELDMTNRDPMLLCAESNDDMKAWQIALEEGRTMPSANANGPAIHAAPPGYVNYGNSYGVRTTQYTAYPYPGQPTAYPYPGGQTTVVHSPMGNTTTYVVPPVQQQVVYVDDYPYRHRHYNRSGLFLGPTFWW